MHSPKMCSSKDSFYYSRQEVDNKLLSDIVFLINSIHQMQGTMQETFRPSLISTPFHLCKSFLASKSGILLLISLSSVSTPQWCVLLGLLCIIFLELSLCSMLYSSILASMFNCAQENGSPLPTIGHSFSGSDSTSRTWLGSQLLFVKKHLPCLWAVGHLKMLLMKRLYILMQFTDFRFFWRMHP